MAFWAACWLRVFWLEWVFWWPVCQGRSCSAFSPLCSLSCPVGRPCSGSLPAIWLYEQDATGWAIFLALWGLLVVGTAYNFIKPYLIGHGSDLPFIIVLLGVLGGAIAFGVIGIFLGPTLLAL